MSTTSGHHKLDTGAHLLPHEVLVRLRLLVLRRLHGALIHPVDALLALWTVAAGSLRVFVTGQPLESAREGRRNTKGDRRVAVRVNPRLSKNVRDYCCVDCRTRS